MRGRVAHLGGVLAAAPIALLAAAGCGGDGEAAQLADLVPPDVPLYAEVTVRPEGEQLEALESLAERLGDVSDPRAELAAAIDAELADEGLEATYADDVEPWLGERAAIFVRSFEPSSIGTGVPDFALIAQASDPAAADGFVDDLVEAGPAPAVARSYRGTEYYALRGDGGVAAVGIVGDALVAGTEASFQVAVDATKGESLAESEDYAARADALGEDLLATISLDPSSVIEAAIASEDVARRHARRLEPLVGGPLSAPLTAGISGTEGSLTTDFAALVESGGEYATDSSLLEPLPSGSWLALALPDLGRTIGHALDRIANSGLPGSDSMADRVRAETGFDLRAGLTDWLGDAAAYARGTAVPGLSAGVIAQTTDPDRPRPLLRLLQRFAERDTGLRSTAPPEGAQYGFSLGLPSLGGGVEAGVVDDRVVAVFGGTVAGALDQDRTLGEDERFRAAVESLGEEYPAALYLDVPSLLAALRALGEEIEFDEPAAGALAELDLIVAGSRLSDHVVVTRVSATLDGEGE